MTKLADSFVTATLIFIGVSAAVSAECIFLVCLIMGVLTGVGGGLIRQIIFDIASLQYKHVEIISTTNAALICVVLISFRHSQEHWYRIFHSK